MKGSIQIAICVCMMTLFVGVDIIIGSLDPSAKVARCLLDTSCHAGIAALIWLGTVNLGRRRLRFDDVNMSRMFHIHTILTLLKEYKEVGLSLFIGSAVDVDHFIAAGSISLTHATHLQSRPIGHMVLAAALASCAALLLSALCLSRSGCLPSAKSVEWYRSKRYALLTFSAYIAHLLRDSVRRGLWFCTLPASITGSGEVYMITTPPLELWVVLTIYCMMPRINHFVLSRWKTFVANPDYDYGDVESQRGEARMMSV